MVYSHIRLCHGTDKDQGGVSWSFSWPPAPQTQEVTLPRQPAALPKGSFHVCSAKSVPKTANTPYGWCPSPEPGAHKSREEKPKRRGAGSETPTAPFLVFRSVRKDSLLKPCSTFPAVLAPPYSWSFLERLRSNRTGKQEGKESSASPSAPGPSPADPAEMTGRGLAEFWGEAEKRGETFILLLLSLITLFLGKNPWSFRYDYPKSQKNRISTPAAKDDSFMH